MHFRDIIQVVNDGDMQLWRELGVNSWPTFAVVGPEGKLIAQLAGEGRRKVFPSTARNFPDTSFLGMICLLNLESPDQQDSFFFSQGS